MRVMLDSNVLLSALLFPGETISKLMVNVTSECSLVLSSYIIDEVFDDVIVEKPEIITPAEFVEKY